MKERLGLPEEGHGYTAKTLYINITPSVPQRDLGFVVVVCLSGIGEKEIIRLLRD